MDQRQKEYYQAKIKEAVEIATSIPEAEGEVDVWALAIFEKSARPLHYLEKEMPKQ